MSGNPIAEKRIKAMLNGELMTAYRKSVKRLSTKDLVIFVDGASNGAVVDVFTRQSLLEQPSLPPVLLGKLRRSAREVSHLIKDSDEAFWLVAAFDDLDEVTCVAINSKMLLPGGTA